MDRGNHSYGFASLEELSKFQREMEKEANS